MIARPSRCRAPRPRHWPGLAQARPTPAPVPQEARLTRQTLANGTRWSGTLVLTLPDRWRRMVSLACPRASQSGLCPGPLALGRCRCRGRSAGQHRAMPSTLAGTRRGTGQWRRVSATPAQAASGRALANWYRQAAPAAPGGCTPRRAPCIGTYGRNWAACSCNCVPTAAPRKLMRLTCTGCAGTATDHASRSPVHRPADLSSGLGTPGTPCKATQRHQLGPARNGRRANSRCKGKLTLQHRAIASRSVHPGAQRVATV